MAMNSQIPRNSPSTQGSRKNLPTRTVLLHSFAQAAKHDFSINPFAAVKPIDAFEHRFFKLCQRLWHGPQSLLIFLEAAQPGPNDFTCGLVKTVFDFGLNELFKLRRQGYIHSAIPVISAIPVSNH